MGVFDKSVSKIGGERNRCTRFSRMKFWVNHWKIGFYGRFFAIIKAKYLAVISPKRFTGALPIEASLFSFYARE
jgi:hypothetical protein